MMWIFWLPCGIRGSIEVVNQIGPWCIRYPKIDNTSWVSFGSSVCGGGNAVSSGLGSPLGKVTRYSTISITGHGSKVCLSVK